MLTTILAAAGAAAAAEATRTACRPRSAKAA